MNIKYTPKTLKNLEQLLEEARFRVRYEKGSFNSGYCLLENQKVAVINKFLNIEGRINTLIEMVSHLKIDTSALSDEMRILYNQIIDHKSSSSQMEIGFE